MKARIIIYGGLLVGLLAIYLWWSAPRRDTERRQARQIAELMNANPLAPEVLTNPAVRDWVRPLGISDTDWQSATAMRHLMLAMNKKIEFHAQALDQHGNGVAGAVLELELTRVDEDKVLREFPNMKMGSELVSEKLQLTSDADGWFHLTGRRGRMVIVEGLQPGDGYFWQQNGYPSFDFDDSPVLKPHEDPARGYTFHLWKKGAPERLVRVECSVVVQPFGTNWYAVNLFEGQVQDVKTGDFKFWFETKKDANGNPARQFRFEVSNGGLCIDSDPYPYLAPSAGYVPTWDWYYEPYGRHANQNVQALLKKSFYVKARNGQVFGAITWHWASENAVSIIGYLNPAGSRNLEPDPEKLITNPEEIRRLNEQTRTR